MEINDRLEIKVVGAENLILVNGMRPSAFVEVQVGNDVMRTKTIPENQEPVWDTPPMIFTQILTNCIDTIFVKITNKDSNKGVESPMGYVVMAMDTPFNSPGIEIDAWYELKQSSDMNFEGKTLGRVRLVITYYNAVDPAVVMALGSGPPQGAPNILQIHVSDALKLGGGRASVDAFVSIQVADLRKETHVCRKNLNPSWDEDVHFPVTDGALLIDVTVKHSSVIRSIFLGKCQIAMNEVAEGSELGLTRNFQLLNETLGFDESQSLGTLQMTLKWYFDKEQDEENKRIVNFVAKPGFFTRLKNLIIKPKPVEEETLSPDEEAAALLAASQNEEPAAGDDQMTPFEWAQYLHEKSEARQQEINELLEEPEEEVELPEGDYNLQVHLLELKDVPLHADDSMPNPMAMVEIMGQKQFSRAKYGSTGDFYDEKFYFYFTGLKKEQIAEASMRISIIDHSWFNPLKVEYFLNRGIIGTYQADMIQIYNSKDHEMYRRWGTLRNAYDEDDKGPRGLVKFSAVCLGPGDKQRPHDPSREPNDDEEAEGDVEATEGAAVVDAGSGAGAATLQFLVIAILRADGLPGFDRFISTIKTGLYCYIQAEFAGCKPVKTTKVSVMGRKSLSVTFEEEIWIPVWVPTYSKRCAITVMNSEIGRSDQVVATAYFDFEDVTKYEKDPLASGMNPMAFLGLGGRKQYTGKELQYLHFYGANPIVRGGPKAARFMNKFPNYGSAYRGSLLCSLRRIKKHFGNETPHKQAMNYDIASSLLPQNARYTCKVMVYSGTDFGNKGFGGSKVGGKYALSVAIGSYEIRSAFLPYENGGVDWVELLENQDFMLPASIALLPDIFITLLRGTESSFQSVAYMRIKSLSIVQNYTNVKAQWYELQHDQSHKSNPLIKGYPGSVLLRIALVNAEDITKPMEWDSERIKMNIKEPYQLRCYIFQCRGLPAINDNGLIDPYVKVRFSGSKAKTSVKKMTQAPCFFETLEFAQVLPPDKKLAPNIVLQVWDSKFGSKTPVGVARASLEGVFITRDQARGAPTPQWMPLKGVDGQGNMGEILASFQLYQKETLAKLLTPPREIVPNTRKCYLDIHVVGLRNLIKLKPGLLTSNVRYPYLEMDLCSHAYGDKLQSSTSRVPSPNNPNFLDRHVVLTSIPDDPLYCPTLEIRVYDQRRLGAVLIAVGNINLSSKLPWNGSEFVPPRQHSIMSGAMRARKEMEEAARNKMKNKGKAKVEEEEVVENGKVVEKKIMDEGYGIFPPEVGAAEPGAKYLELPSVMDQEEIDAARKAFLAELALEDGALLDEGKAGDRLRKIIGFPGAWSKSNFMDKRDFWIDSKKPNEGGQLEDYLKTYAFENYDLFRGHIAFNKFGKRKDTTIKCGLLKMVVRVCPKNPRSDEEYGAFIRTIRKVEKCTVRAYIIKAQNLQPLDWLGSSDPYLKVSLGDKEFRDFNVKFRNLNPEFFKVYEFTTTLPGPSLLKVALWDKNLISSDVLMGETIVDLEDRWYHPKWTSLDKKPVEARTLIKKGAGDTSQGLVYMWIDIFRTADSLFEQNKLIEIAGPEKKKFQLRVSCWRSLEVPNMDGNKSDLFVQFGIAGTGKFYGTDTHWMCKGGAGSWNWRCIIPIELPIVNREEGRLNIQMMERNIFTANTLIGANTINMYDWFMLAYVQNKTIASFKMKREALKQIEEEDYGDGPPEEPEEEDNEEEEAPADEAGAGGKKEGGDGDEGEGGGGGDEEEEDDDDDDENKKLIEKKLEPVAQVVEEEPGPKEPPKEKEEGSNIMKIVTQVYVMLGVGDYIADDAEWVKLTFHDRERNRLLQRGRVALSIHIVPETEYENDPVGSGRSEPNKDPYLPPPTGKSLHTCVCFSWLFLLCLPPRPPPKTGRFSFSIDPIKIMSELCPMWLRICLCCCCCCCCCMLFLILAMTQLSGVMSLVDLIESMTPTDPPTMAPSYR